jgi:hypothetical protein
MKKGFLIFLTVLKGKEFCNSLTCKAKIKKRLHQPDGGGLSGEGSSDFIFISPA